MHLMGFVRTASGLYHRPMGGRADGERRGEGKEATRSNVQPRLPQEVTDGARRDAEGSHESCVTATRTDVYSGTLPTIFHSSGLPSHIQTCTSLISIPS